jgi:hypothetical protein
MELRLAKSFEFQRFPPCSALTCAAPARLPPRLQPPQHIRRRAARLSTGIN